MNKLVIFGVGDIARLAQYYFTRDSDYELAAFTVDREYRSSDSFMGLPVVDFEDVVDAFPPTEYLLFIAVSYTQLNRVRAGRYLRAKELGYRLPSYVSSRCTYLSDQAPGENCLILEDNTIQPYVRIGNNVTLWSGNHIGHDSTIGDHCFLASHIVVSGHVSIEPYCFIGVNATLRNGISIGARTVIGAGALVMADTQEDELLVPERTRPHVKRSDEIEL